MCKRTLLFFLAVVPVFAFAAPARAASTDTIVLEVLTLDKAIAELSTDTTAVAALYQAVAEVYMRQHKLLKATSLLATYDHDQGQDIGLLNQLGYLYQQQPGTLERAVKLQEKIVNLDPESNWERARPRLAELYLSKGDTVKARRITEGLLSRDPENQVYLRQLSQIQQASGDWQLEDTEKKLIRISPQDSDYLRLAEMYVKKKTYDDAVTVLEDGIAKLPSAVYTLTKYLAQVYVLKSDIDKGIRLLNDLVWKVTDTDQKNDVKANIKQLENLKSVQSQAAANVVVISTQTVVVVSTQAAAAASVKTKVVVPAKAPGKKP